MTATANCTNTKRIDNALAFFIALTIITRAITVVAKSEIYDASREVFVEWETRFRSTPRSVSRSKAAQHNSSLTRRRERRYRCVFQARLGYAMKYFIAIVQLAFGFGLFLCAISPRYPDGGGMDTYNATTTARLGNITAIEGRSPGDCSARGTKC
jgi:hypothetical protein